MEWKTDTEIVVDDVSFVLAPTDTTGGRARAQAAGALLLRKARWMVERYLRLASDTSPGNVVELGIYDGGSAALLSLLFAPHRLVALDIEPERVEALDRFIEARGLHDVIRPYYGIDQGDTARLGEIITAEFGRDPLDLVIDDASHLLVETTASFNALFPRLRPGGLFVIEDWSWQHFNDEAFAEALVATEAGRAEITRRLEHPEPPDEPLSRLVVEILLTAAYDEHVVAEVTSARKGWLIVERGDGELDAATFDISASYGTLGRSLLGKNR